MRAQFDIEIAIGKEGFDLFVKTVNQGDSASFDLLRKVIIDSAVADLDDKMYFLLNQVELNSDLDDAIGFALLEVSEALEHEGVQFGAIILSDDDSYSSYAEKYGEPSNLEVYNTNVIEHIEDGIERMQFASLDVNKQQSIARQALSNEGPADIDKAINHIVQLAADSPNIYALHSLSDSVNSKLTRQLTHTAVKECLPDMALLIDLSSNKLAP